MVLPRADKIFCCLYCRRSFYFLQHKLQFRPVERGHAPGEGEGGGYLRIAKLCYFSVSHTFTMVEENFEIRHRKEDIVFTCYFVLLSLHLKNSSVSLYDYWLLWELLAMTKICLQAAPATSLKISRARIAVSFFFYFSNYSLLFIGFVITMLRWVTGERMFEKVWRYGSQVNAMATTVRKVHICRKRVQKIQENSTFPKLPKEWFWKDPEDHNNIS